MRLLIDQMAPGVWIPEFLILKPEGVSRAVMQAIQKQKFEVVIPLWLAVVCVFKGLMPSIFRLLCYHALRLRTRQQIKKGP